jgi:hypothetical protein
VHEPEDQFWFSARKRRSSPRSAGLTGPPPAFLTSADLQFANVDSPVSSFLPAAAIDLFCSTEYATVFSRNSTENDLPCQTTPSFRGESRPPRSRCAAGPRPDRRRACLPSAGARRLTPRPSPHLCQWSWPGVRSAERAVRCQGVHHRLGRLLPRTGARRVVGGGRPLPAHEVAHAVQQQGGAPQRSPPVAAVRARTNRVAR